MENPKAHFSCENCKSTSKITYKNNTYFCSGIVKHPHPTCDKIRFCIAKNNKRQNVYDLMIEEYMAQHPNNSPNSEINNAIQVLERRDLDNLPILDLSSNARAGGGVPWGGAKFDFLRVKAVARNIADNKADVERFMMEDVLAGLYGLKAPFIYLIIGTRLEIKIFLGILNKPVSKPSPSFFLDVLAASLQSTFPDIEVEYLTNDKVDSQIIQFFKK